MQFIPFSARRSLRLLGNLCISIGATGLLAGCGGPGFEVAPARGKVVCGGKPVTVGTVILTPVAEGAEPGKSAIAAVQSDGTFVLSTYEQGDGAILGKHRVIYSPPEEFEEEEEGQPEVEEGSAEEARLNAARAKELQDRARNACVLAKEMTVEVTADGKNDFTIELVPAGASQDQ